jgi:hypothetical protein
MALRLVTQGFISSYKPASTTTTKDSDEPQDPTTKAKEEPAKRHRDPSIATAMEMLHTAGYEYSNDDALYTLANIMFVSITLPLLLSGSRQSNTSCCREEDCRLIVIIMHLTL